MKVVLATAPRAGGALERSRLPFLGIGYIASVLEQKGFTVNIVDVHTKNYSEERAVTEILRLDPQAVGITATTHNRFHAIKMAALLRKKSNVLIFTGGPHFSLTARNALEKVPAIDVIVRGEGEMTTLELLNAYAGKKGFTDVAGITYREGNEIKETEDRPFLRSLDELPSPAWHLYPMDEYRRPIDDTSIPAIGVISARGCPNRCAYCANAAFGQSVLRRRSPESFVDELEYLKNEYGFEGFNFWDDTFNIVRSHAVSICEEVIKRKLRIRWYARARVHPVDKTLLELMKEAGCIAISFGVESGSPRILELIRKRITLDQVRQAVKLAADTGMKVRVNFIISLPEETIDDIRQTVELMKELRNYGENVKPVHGFTYILPGTELERMAKERGVLARDFSWNTPVSYPKNVLAGCEREVPYYVTPSLPLEEIKAYVARNYFSSTFVLRRAYRLLRRIRSWQEFGDYLRLAVRYFFGQRHF